MDSTESDSVETRRQPGGRSFSRALILVGTLCAAMSLWTNPAAFGQQVAWLPDHNLLLLLGFITIIPGAWLKGRDRRDAEGA